MSELAKLLEGVQVEWMALGEVSELVRGNGLQKKDFTQTGVPAIHYGQIYTYYGLSATETKSFISPELAKTLMKVDEGDIVITNTSENLEDVGKAVVYLGKTQAVTGGHATIIKPSQLLLGKYFAFFTQTEEFATQKRKYAKGTKVIDVSATDMSKIRIPIPPISAQKEIVRILDTFTERTDTLINELTTELEARKKQYNYYREKLLSFEKDEIKWMELGKLTSVLRGKRLIREQLSNVNKFPVFHGGLEPLGYYDQKNRPAYSVMIINVGASAGTVGYSDVDFWSSDGCYSIKHSDKLNNKFLYYYLIGQQHFLVSRVRKAGIPTLDAPVIEKLQIPIPSLVEQKRIVAILDKLESLTTSISEALSKEIALRKKQYEYYRDLLLTFPKDNVKA